MFEPVDAIESLRGTQREVCFFGHTHVAIGYWMSASAFDVIVPDPNDETTLELVRRAALHAEPGVGRAAARRGPARGVRDLRLGEADGAVPPRALRRGSAAQSKIVKAGLPEGLARRLAVGK